MFSKICYIIVQIALYFEILEWITYRTVHRNRRYKRVCYLGLVLIEVVLAGVVLESSAWGDIVFIFACMAGLFIYLCMSDKGNSLLYNFSMVISAIMVEIVYLTILTIPCSYLCLWISGDKNFFLVRIILTIADIVSCICLSFFGEKISLYKLFEHRGIRVISTVLGICIIILQQIGLYLSKSNRGKVNIIIANFFIFVIIFSILWLLDHYRLAAGKLKAEQDSRKMNSNLHKTKELMPLLISVVNENEGLLDPQLVEEFNQIYSEQMITGREENMNYKLLGTTGIKLLDSQLQHYILECSKKGIIMDVFASEPIGKQLHEMHIAQLMLHNVIGDLLRNAMRAIERSGRTDGKILVILGKKEGVVELDIFDNGEEIPFPVLERFGQRGLTTGGTGNGLADITEMLKDYQISLIVKENEPGSSTYAKGFMLVFDGKNRRELRTCRSGKEKLKELGYWMVISEESSGDEKE